jgi:hypothetical protein
MIMKHGELALLHKSSREGIYSRGLYIEQRGLLRSQEQQLGNARELAAVED